MHNVIINTNMLHRMLCSNIFHRRPRFRFMPFCFPDIPQSRIKAGDTNLYWVNHLFSKLHIRPTYFNLIQCLDNRDPIGSANCAWLESQP
ncbi:hypothetical protein CEXT_176911 [Caerostris extrusa]|uniref:Uncharacterized protein n=1 Tax=Caerostris extrusa TaxID=172846 RepID=A0AAV4T1N3_CAEEX|nr:hypothetical protein CEXT_176911 [Caerostris extrusa]